LSPDNVALDLPPLALNQSGLKEYNQCQRRYGWRRLENLEPPTRRSAPEIGSAVHAALAAYHAGTPVDDSLKIAAEKLTERVGPGTTFEDRSLDESQDIAFRLLREYVYHWSGRGELWAPLNQEIQFLIEVRPGWWKQTFDPYTEAAALPPTGIFLRGRADNLSVLKGALFLVDYKTAARLDPRDLLKYSLDTQLSAYIYGLSKQLTEDAVREGGDPIKIQGAIIDLLVKTKIPQFAREDFTRTDDELEEFEREFVEYGQRIQRQLARVAAGEDWKTVFPKNTEDCFRYGTCAFRDLCLKDTPTRRLAYVKRESDYVDEAQQELLKQYQERR
jgi:hypothetical protein